MPTYVGTLGNDTIGSEASSYDVIYGLDGDDIIYGYFSPVRPPNDDGQVLWPPASSMLIDGGDGNDILSFDGTLYHAIYLSRGPSQEGDFTTFGTIHGGRGDDTISGSGIRTAAGIPDLLYGDEGNDIIMGGDFSNLIYGGTGTDYLVGGDGADIIDDGEDWDSVYGGGGNDYITSGPGNDVLSGDDGDDTIWTLFGFDYMVGGAGNDLLAFGGNESGQAYGGTGNDVIVGNEADNFMQGDTGNDYLYGLGGDDTLAGGDGQDSLSGGLGADYLLGGMGADAFYFTDGGINTGQYDQVADWDVGLFGFGDLIFLPSSYQSLTHVLDTSLGALVQVQLGTGSWGAYVSVATAAQVQDQVIFV